MSRVLVAHACHSGRAREIAEQLAQCIRARGYEVEVANAREGRLPPPQDYDAVILGSRVEHGHHAHELLDYVREYRHVLEQMPTAFYSVSMAAAVPFAGADPGGHLARLVAECDWMPDHVARFGRIGQAQAWKLADLVAVSLAELKAGELSPSFGPI
jgi:menaquinone-dependent protoporphyrinogen oxidase